MGRYSIRLAPLFADFAGVSAGRRALDVGAGTGALTAALVPRGASVVAGGSVAGVRGGPAGAFPRASRSHEAPAESLPFATAPSTSRSPSSSSPSCRTRRPRSRRWRGSRQRWRSACGAWRRSTCSRAIGRTAQAVGCRRAEPGARRYRTPEELHDLLAGRARERRDARARRDCVVPRLRRLLEALDGTVRAGRSWLAVAPRASSARGRTRSCTGSSALRRARSSCTAAPSPRGLRAREHGFALGAGADQRHLDVELALDELDVARAPRPAARPPTRKRRAAPPSRAASRTPAAPCGSRSGAPGSPRSPRRRAAGSGRTPAARRSGRARRASSARAGRCR